MAKPKLTIITINKNNSIGLEKTLSSIHSCCGDRVSVIVVDGNSTDNSEIVIKKYKNKFKKYLIIYDKKPGIYNAMNFGYSNVDYGYFTFLNSGDSLCDNFNCEEIFNYFKSYKENCIFYCNINWISSHGSVVRRFRPGEFRKYKLFLGWMPPHPFLIDYKKLGTHQEKIFDEKLTISADYDYILRRVYVELCEVVYLKSHLVLMENGGVSNGSLINIFRANIQVIKSWNRYTMIPPFYLLILKPLLKVLQKFGLK